MASWDNKLAAQWKDAANLVLGLWLLISPWVLGYAGQSLPAWNAHVVGAIIAVAAVAALNAFQQWEEWVNVAFGAWLIVSPYLLGISGPTSALWNQIIVGLVVAILALWAVMTTTERGSLRT